MVHVKERVAKQQVMVCKDTSNDVYAWALHALHAQHETTKDSLVAFNGSLLSLYESNCYHYDEDGNLDDEKMIRYRNMIQDEKGELEEKSKNSLFSSLIPDSNTVYAQNRGFMLDTRYFLPGFKRRNLLFFGKSFFFR